VLLFRISEATAVAVIAAVAIGLSFVILAVVAWIFWRAAQRDKQIERDRKAGG
jgi:ABC-type sulfate transport system permease component